MSATLEATSREEIYRLQHSKLQRLLKSVRATNCFYRSKLRNVPEALPPDLAEALAALPFTSKLEIARDQLEHPPYGTNLTFSLSHYSRIHQTSGSTATPIRWLDTTESWSCLVDNWQRIFNRAGVVNADKFFFAFSFGPFLGFWTAIEAVHRMGLFCFPGGGMSSASRAKSIMDNTITVLCCTPTYAQHLGNTLRELYPGQRSSVRLIIVAGEPGGSIPATRTRIESFWPGAAVFDHHGMTEVGPVSYECPCEPCLLHVLECAYVAEVITPSTGARCPVGDRGELVLTTLDRIGSPLIRYRTGDLVKARPPGCCHCGSHELALQGGIIGRADDMVVVRGVNVFPSAVEEVLCSNPNVSEYRVTVDSRGPMTELEIDIETAPSCGDGAKVCHQIADALHSALNLRIPVRAVEQGALPRYEMKARRWIRLTEGLV